MKIEKSAGVVVRGVWCRRIHVVADQPGVLSRKLKSILVRVGASLRLPDGKDDIASCCYLSCLPRPVANVVVSKTMASDTSQS